ncbi:hypothetical protein [Ktedonosporobacter rubrisoli]|nr:hypothetical protein [Ktedonosporobacter rubrisoli]
MMKRNPESTVPTRRWIAPTIEVIQVSLECTAYAGAQDLEE